MSSKAIEWALAEEGAEAIKPADFEDHESGFKARVCHGGAHIWLDMPGSSSVCINSALLLAIARWIIDTFGETP